MGIVIPIVLVPQYKDYFCYLLHSTYIYTYIYTYVYTYIRGYIGSYIGVIYAITFRYIKGEEYSTPLEEGESRLRLIKATIFLLLINLVLTL